MSEANNHNQDYPNVLSKINTTTKLLGLVLLVSQAVLILSAERFQGIAQILLIVNIGLVLLTVVGGAIYLEKVRIDLDSKVTSLEGSNPKPKKYKVFISTPMASLDDDVAFREQRTAVMGIKDALRLHCDLEPTFYAGTDIKSVKGFEMEDLALRLNFQALKESDKFIMIYPARLPSSMLVEVGMALAMGKDSVWFVKKNADLPYLLRDGANASHQDGLPIIRVYEYSTLKDIESHMERLKKSSSS